MEDKRINMKYYQESQGGAELGRIGVPMIHSETSRKPTSVCDLTHPYPVCRWIHRCPFCSPICRVTGQPSRIAS